MKVLLTAAALLLLPACGFAQAETPAPAATPAQAAGPKSCDELKSEIAAKLDAKGVKSYTLDIVAKDQDAADGKVVGTCGGGTNKIIYRRGAAPAEKPAKDEKKPEN
ncbi:MAG TPA: DUF1161 domain-containing protein [Candidatus Acidoferrum sp.]|nr:DUF1161 domain-containing protein [Candidatus Acidoferrum sp.]